MTDANTGIGISSPQINLDVGKRDGEIADEAMRKHEEKINVTRKESYLNASKVIDSPSYGSKDVEWDKLDPTKLSETLEVSLKNGLTSSEAAKRLERDGPNELEKAKRPSLATLFLLQLLNLIIVLLICAALASIVVNGTGPGNDNIVNYVDSIAIFIIVFLNAAIGAVTENSAAGALEALSKMSQPKATVIRDGQEVQIASVKIVQGDIVVLGVGDIVPADVRLVEADDFKVNEMLLTGEPDDVGKFARMKQKKQDDGDGHGHGEKLTPENMAFSSCMCTSGKAKTVVVATGMRTRVGKIAKLLSASDETKSKKSCLPDTSSNMTPLQAALQKLGVKIGIGAIAICAAVFVIGLALNVYAISRPLLDTRLDSFVYMILTAVTLAVAAIPEGIPLCVTISLSTGSQDMVKRNVLVRRIAAVETLGCASVICTDKTGTLTEGKMTMVKMWSSGTDFDVSGKGFDPTVGKITYKSGDKAGSDAKDFPGVVMTLTSALACSNTRVVQEVDPDDGKTKWTPHGNSSEAPIVVAAGKIGKKVEDIEKAMPRNFEVPFSSARKMMLTVTEVNDASGSSAFTKEAFAGLFKGADPKFLAHVKGAPNFIIKDCDSWTNAAGEVQPFTEEQKSTVMKRVDELSSEALRVLAVAVRRVDVMPFDPKDKDLDMSADDKFKSLVKQSGLILLGLVASIDPERDGVPQAVLDAQGGYIRVVMITGDYLPTARAIGFNVNILKEGDDVNSAALDCGKLRPDGKYLSDDDIDYLTKTVKVFARAQPEDKLQIVKSLQRQGLVCAMTGDGVNDAPALKKADIGVAMGIQGTEVAKGASDMILTDDNFCSIVSAVEKGRIIYAGIQKFVVFIMSVHFAEVAQIFLCIVAQIPVMRTPLQILFLILVTDLPPSVALGMEKVAGDILKDRPRPKEESIVQFWQWQAIVANGMILTTSTIAVYMWGLNYYLDSTFTVNDVANLFCQPTEADILDAELDIDNLEEFTARALQITDCSAYQDLLDNETFAIEYEDAPLNEDSIEQLVLARTSAFISLVYSENIRAYTSRHFTDPMWVNMCANWAMQRAIGFAQIALYCAVFIPGLSNTIMQLQGADIGWEGWVAALLGGLYTVVMCEIYKWATKGQVFAAQRKVAEAQDKAEAERLALADKRRKEMEQASAKNGSEAVKS